MQLDNAIEALRSEKADAAARLEKVTLAIETLEGLNDKPAPKVRHISASGRARMAQAQKRRWAKAKNTSGRGNVTSIAARRPRSYKGLHWTQRPENKRKLAASIRKMNAARMG